MTVQYVRLNDMSRGVAGERRNGHGARGKTSMEERLEGDGETEEAKWNLAMLKSPTLKMSPVEGGIRRRIRGRTIKGGGGCRMTPPGKS